MMTTCVELLGFRGLCVFKLSDDWKWICLPFLCDLVWTLPTPWALLAVGLDEGISHLVSSSET